MPDRKPTPEEIRIAQLHDAVVAALRELATLRPGSFTGIEAALNSLGERV